MRRFICPVCGCVDYACIFTILLAGQVHCYDCNAIMKYYKKEN